MIRVDYVLNDLLSKLTNAEIELILQNLNQEIQEKENT